MIHVVGVITLIALLYPLYSLYLHAKECNYILAVATIPEIYSKLHSDSYIANIERTRTSYLSAWGMFAATVVATICLGLTWMGTAVGIYVGPFAVGVTSLLVSAMLVYLWTFHAMPIWLFNWKIELLTCRDTINLKRVEKRLLEIQTMLQLMTEPTTEEEAAKFEHVMEEVKYLVGLAEVLDDNLKRIPTPIKQ